MMEVEAFLDFCRFERGLREATIHSYRYALKHFDKHGGGEPPNETTVKGWLREMIQKGKNTNTIWLYFAAIMLYLQWRADERADETAGESVKVLRKIRLPQRYATGRAISQEKVERWLSQPDLFTWEGIYYRAMLELLYGCGLRINEACTLAGRDIDLEQGFVWVITERAKNCRERKVAIPAGSLEYLRRYAHDREHFADGSPWFFPAFQDAQHHASDITARRAIIAYAKAAGLGHQKPHTLRHSCVTHLLENGASVRAAQHILGHASLKTTEGYLHFQQQLADRAQIECHPRSRPAEAPIRRLQLLESAG